METIEISEVTICSAKFFGFLQVKFRDAERIKAERIRSATECEIRNEQLARDKKYNIASAKMVNQTTRKELKHTYESAALARELQMKRQQLEMQLNAARADSQQLKAEQGRTVTVVEGDNRRETHAERIKTELDLTTPAIKQSQFIEFLQTALTGGNRKTFHVTNIGGSDDVLDPVGQLIHQIQESPWHK